MVNTSVIARSACLRLPADRQGRQEATKPCPEQSEGTPEIATGFALATTLGRIATPACRNALRRAGTLPAGRSQ